MGLSVGLIVHGLTKAERKAAYAADITYGTNNEMGFDYLRDNMAIYDRDLVQRGQSFAIAVSYTHLFFNRKVIRIYFILFQYLNSLA